MMDVKNIFSNIPDIQDSEIFQDIINRPGFKLERIISAGHATPEGQWYDQDWDEWVVLLSGSACLTFADGKKDYELKPGDFLLIPSHTKHRVKWTSEKEKTVWLALHFENNEIK